jgi:cytochrome c553
VIGLMLAASAAVALCESCHGADGNSAVALTPSIAAQPATFLENQLVYFREGLRNAPVMQAVAKDLKDEDIRSLAAHFSARKARAAATAREPVLATRGVSLVRAMHCGQCHLPGFQGREQMPRLAGQREDYLVLAMKGYRDGTRTGADTTMAEVLYAVSDADIRALAHYLAGLE